MRKRNKKKVPEFDLEYKFVHGQLVPVKIFPAQASPAWRKTVYPTRRFNIDSLIVQMDLMGQTAKRRQTSPMTPGKESLVTDIMDMLRGWVEKGILWN